MWAATGEVKGCAEEVGDTLVSGQAESTEGRMRANLTTRCSAWDCMRATECNKPYCSVHVALMPYVREVLDGLTAAKKEARAKRKQVSDALKSERRQRRREVENAKRLARRKAQHARMERLEYEERRKRAAYYQQEARKRERSRRRGQRDGHDVCGM